MWTQEQNDAYNNHLSFSRKQSKALGKEIAEMVKPQIQKRKSTEGPNCEGINSIFVPDIIEPLISSLDDGYETLGQVNFKWMIDLYVGRKCKKIIPLLLEVAKRLYEGDHDKGNKKEGGWADGYMWNVAYLDDSISMRWDTQSRSYYIELERIYSGSECWKLYVAEYQYGKKRLKSQNNWEKEPGYVLSYEMRGNDNEKVENAWLYLPQISRFFDMINPSCTSMNFNLYKPPFVK